ncbi:MAG TPA: 23S rRNA (adenine(2030)-N(6))-methyltransferase RlmJ, partial [Cellvibrionaceae bacterium]|nr:23S rRNA (adenine(2030)-N(6))-methyltransferase RlmJ [Cellvibrionaceae bacterium]
RVACHFENGYKQALALVPPVERRGLILIDPSYEVKTEYAQVVSEVKSLHRRFATGVYLIWYPVIEARFVEQLVRGLKNSGIKRINQIEWGLGAGFNEGKGMNATGLLTINAPFTLMPCLEESLNYALPILAPSGEGYVKVETLVGE